MKTSNIVVLSLAGTQLAQAAALPRVTLVPPTDLALQPYSISHTNTHDVDLVKRKDWKNAFKHWEQEIKTKFKTKIETKFKHVVTGINEFINREDLKHPGLRHKLVIADHVFEVYGFFLNAYLLSMFGTLPLLELLGDWARGFYVAEDLIAWRRSEPSPPTDLNLHRRSDTSTHAVGVEKRGFWKKLKHLGTVVGEWWHRKGEKELHEHVVEPFHDHVVEPLLKPFHQDLEDIHAGLDKLHHELAKHLKLAHAIHATELYGGFALGVTSLSLLAFPALVAIGPAVVDFVEGGVLGDAVLTAGGAAEAGATAGEGGAAVIDEGAEAAVAANAEHSGPITEYYGDHMLPWTPDAAVPAISLGEPAPGTDAFVDFADHFYDPPEPMTPSKWLGISRPNAPVVPQPGPVGPAVLDEAAVNRNGLHGGAALNPITEVDEASSVAEPENNAIAKADSPPAMVEPETNPVTQVDESPTAAEPEDNPAHEVEEAPATDHSESNSDHEAEEAPAAVEPETNPVHEEEEAPAMVQSESNSIHEAEEAPAAIATETDSLHEAEKAPAMDHSETNSAHEVEEVPAIFEQEVPPITEDEAPAMVEPEVNAITGVNQAPSTIEPARNTVDEVEEVPAVVAPEGNTIIEGDGAPAEVGPEFKAPERTLTWTQKNALKNGPPVINKDDMAFRKYGLAPPLMV